MFLLRVVFATSNVDNSLGHWLVPRTLGEVTFVVIFHVENIQLATLLTAMIVKEEVSLLMSEFGRPVLVSGVVIV